MWLETWSSLFTFVILNTSRMTILRNEAEWMYPLTLFCIHSGSKCFFKDSSLLLSLSVEWEKKEATLFIPVYIYTHADQLLCPSPYSYLPFISVLFK